jgi:hypothetical protein
VGVEVVGYRKTVLETTAAAVAVVVVPMAKVPLRRRRRRRREQAWVASGGVGGVGRQSLPLHWRDSKDTSGRDHGECLCFGRNLGCCWWR